MISTSQSAIDLVRYLDRVGITLSIKDGQLDVSAEPDVMVDFDAEGLTELRKALDEHGVEVARIVSERDRIVAASKATTEV